MATFKVQIEDLVGAIGDDNALTQWLQDGTREVINILPLSLKEYCYTKQTFTSNAANSEAETMITGQLGSVYAGSVECRQIRPTDKHKASSSSSLEFASSSDPVYYIEGNKINILPASSSGIYYVVANPTVAHGSSSIDNFPNEAEYLVVLYASIKATEFLMLREEDPEIYSPMIQNLKHDYNQAVLALVPESAKSKSGKREK
tara:strand:+ start:942 stop:1550 length:609 start_codon:yes stop_codon:yes gene_type:complete